MYNGALKPVSNLATWQDTIEVISVDDDVPLDFSDVTEVTLTVADRDTSILALSLSGGDIILPGNGVIQWRAEATAMAALLPGTFNVGLLISTSTDTIQLFLGTVSILRGW